MDNNLEARFNHLRKSSLEELRDLREYLVDELDYLRKLLDDSNVSSFQKTETENDIKYDEDKLEYTEYLLGENIHDDSKGKTI